MASFQDILRGLKDVDTGALETATTLGTGMIATPIAGVRGIAGWVDEMTRGSRRPGEAYKRALNLIERTQQDMTYQPRTDLGKRGVENVGKAIHAITEPIERATTDKLAEAGAPGLAAGIIGVANVLDPTKGAGRAKAAVEAAASAAARAVPKAAPKPWKPGVTEGEAAARQLVQESGLGLAEKPPAPRSDPGSPQTLLPGIEPLTPQEALRSAEAARARAIERASFIDKPTSTEFRFHPETSRNYEMLEAPTQGIGAGINTGPGSMELFDFGVGPGGVGRGNAVTTRGGDVIAPNYYEFLGGAGGRPDLAGRLRDKVDAVVEAGAEAQQRQGDVVRAEEIDPQRALIDELRGSRDVMPEGSSSRASLEEQIFREKRDMPVVDEQGGVWQGEQRGGAAVPGTMMYRERGTGGQARGTEIDEIPALAEHQRMMFTQGDIAQRARMTMQDELRRAAVADAERRMIQDWPAIDRMRARRGEGTPAEQLGREQDIMRMKEELPQVYEGDAYQRQGYYYEPTDPQTGNRSIRVREAPPGSSLRSHGDMLERQQELIDAAQNRADIAAREAQMQEAIARGSQLEETIAALRERRDPAMPARQALGIENDILALKHEVPLVDRSTNTSYTPESYRGNTTFVANQRGSRNSRMQPGDFDDPVANTDAQNFADRMESSRGMIDALEQEVARERQAQLQRRAERVAGMGDPNDLSQAVRRADIRRRLIEREPIVQEGEVWRGTPQQSEMRYRDRLERNSLYAPYTPPKGRTPADMGPLEQHAQRYARAQRDVIGATRAERAVNDFLNELRAEEAARVQPPEWVQNLPGAGRPSSLDVPRTAPSDPAVYPVIEDLLYEQMGAQRAMPRLTQRPDFGARDPNAMNREAVDAYIEALRADPERTLQYGGPAPRSGTRSYNIAGDIDALAEHWSNKPQLKGREIEHTWDDRDDAGMLRYPDTDANITYDFHDPRGVAIHSTEVGSGTGKKEGAGGGAALYQLLLENLEAQRQTSYPTTGLTGINQLRILSNVIPAMLRSPGGVNVRNLYGTGSGRAEHVSGISQDLPAIMRAEAEEIASRTRRQGAPERKLWFDGENFRLGNDVATSADIKRNLKELTPAPEATGVGQKSLQRAALFDYIRALPQGQPIDKAAMKKMIEDFVTKYGPIAGLGGAAVGVGSMQDELRDVA